MVVLSLFSDQTKAEAFASARRRAGHAAMIERIGSYWQVAVYFGVPLAIALAALDDGRSW